jgi:hypothetical protein
MPDPRTRTSALADFLLALQLRFHLAEDSRSPPEYLLELFNPMPSEATYGQLYERDQTDLRERFRAAVSEAIDNGTAGAITPLLEHAVALWTPQNLFQLTSLARIQRFVNAFASLQKYVDRSESPDLQRSLMHRQFVSAKKAANHTASDRLMVDGGAPVAPITWTPSRAPADWVKVFQVGCFRTVRRRVDSGNLRGEQLTRKQWRFAFEDLTAEEKQRLIDSN